MNCNRELTIHGERFNKDSSLTGSIGTCCHAPPTTSTTAFTSCLPPCYNCYYCNIYVSLLQLDISPIPQYDVGSDLKRVGLFPLLERPPLPLLERPLPLSSPLVLKECPSSPVVGGGLRALGFTVRIRANALLHINYKQGGNT